MDSNSDGEELKTKKKKYSKKMESVPSNNLGFRPNLHADIIDPRNIKRSQMRTRKKYVSKSKKQNFMTRLRVVIDVTELPEEIESHLFKVTSKSQWKYVKKVQYRTRQQVHCYICLDEHIVAPQITYCGHIYCFHCILMHFTKSINCFACPVCKEIIDQTELKTCEPKYDKEPAIGDQITFSLRYRQGHYIYDAQTLHQDLRDANVIRMKTKGLLPIFRNQLQQIRQQLQRTELTDRNHHYLTQALRLCSQRIHQNEQTSQISHHLPLRDNQFLKQHTIYRYIPKQQKLKLHFFYQQEQGNLIFLHKISKKYIYNTLNKQNPIPVIKSKIIDKEELDFNIQDPQYKELNMFNVGGQVYLVIVDVGEYVGVGEYGKFRGEVEEFGSNRERLEKQQELELEKLRKEYQAEQQYIRKLKQQQQAKYYFDVKLPPTLDPSEINQQSSFPSLISAKSEISNKSQPIESQVLVISKHRTEIEDNKKQKKSKKFDLSKQTQYFPDLSQLQSVQSEPPQMNGNTNNNAGVSGGRNGRRKKKKQKFVDMTHEILFNREEEEDY